MYEEHVTNKQENLKIIIFIKLSIQQRRENSTQVQVRGLGVRTDCNYRVYATRHPAPTSQNRAKSVNEREIGGLRQLLFCTILGARKLTGRSARQVGKNPILAGERDGALRVYRRARGSLRRRQRGVSGEGGARREVCVVGRYGSEMVVSVSIRRFLAFPIPPFRRSLPGTPGFVFKPHYQPPGLVKTGGR